MDLLKSYDPLPTYPCVAGEISADWTALCADLPESSAVLAVDGPAVLDWNALMSGITTALRRRGVGTRVIAAGEWMVGWDQIEERTAPVESLSNDPDFATLATGSVADLFDQLPDAPRCAQQLAIVAGPGAALVDHDILWYADLPKRYAEASVTAGNGRNLGQPEHSGPASTRRLFYIDWPLLDRHRDALARRIDRWIDMRDPTSPTWVSGHVLRASLAALSAQPFRTRPVFNTTSWGGHWAQSKLGVHRDARNTALGYELIAPESGVLLGTDGAAIEVPLQLLVSLHPDAVLGRHVQQRFGSSFPVRFDYLDTFGGGNLSVHCHPTEQDMRDTFGWPYAQHESYYVMVSDEGNVVYLGLRDDASVQEFYRCAQAADQRSAPFDIERFVQVLPAVQHQLFLVPAGTPHGSGAGNVVLEVSATPYLYSLRFYDWLRCDRNGERRPVHVQHAFRNLNADRRGSAVTDQLVPKPRTLVTGPGWHEELLGSLPDIFFEVRRLVLSAGSCATQHTGDRFHVLNLVDGEAATIRWSDRSHRLAYAETILIPAAVGTYQIESDGRSPARVVKAVVR